MLGDNMWFLIGVVLLIVFVVFCYFFIKIKINNFTMKYLGTTDLKSAIEKAELEDEVTPKSLSSMDSVYLEQIKKDFPDININELKRMSEKVILDCYNSIEKKDSSGINNSKIKSFVDIVINDLGEVVVSYDNFKFHKTVVSKYENNNGIATIYFGSSFEYYYTKGDSIRKRVQDRAKCEFIYVYDVDKVSHSKKVLGLNCPNCGSPIKSLGNKKCSYCGSGIIDIVKKVWTCNDIVRY